MKTNIFALACYDGGKVVPRKVAQVAAVLARYGKSFNDIKV